MPRLKVTEKRRDPIKALILERKLAYGISDDALAEKMGVCRQTMSVMLNRKHTDEWPLGAIKKACRILRITADELRSAVQFV